MSEPAAAVAVLHALNPGSVLLMRRAERHGDPWSGHWSFPGGRREPGDPNLIATALRELREECAVDLAHTHFETALRPRVAGQRTRPLMLVAPFVFTVDSELDAVPDLEEATEARWLPLGHFQDPANHRLARIPGLDLDALFPAVDLPGFPLWGFTYRVLTDWLGLVPPPGNGREQASLLAASRFYELLSGGKPPAWKNREAILGGKARRELLENLSGEIPNVNAIEFRPGGVHIRGLDFEDYVILEP